MNEQLTTVLKVLRLRQAALRVHTAKLGHGLAGSIRDDRLYDMFVYHPAHTGRWSSRGMQLHNLPRGLGVDWEALLNDFTLASCDREAQRLTAKRRETDPTAPEITTDDVLASLVRLCLIAAPGHSLVVVDYAQVECRCLAWMAREEGLLRDLQGDVYIGMAKRLFDTEIAKGDPRRQVGKVVVLGCGYGMSHRKLDLYCKNQRVNLEASGITAEEAVKGFRTAYPGIPRLWHLFDARCKLAIEEGYRSSVGRCDIGYDDHTLWIKLPSGRRLNYRAARVEMCQPGYAKFLGIEVKDRPTILYDGPRGTKTLYGGKIVENVDQAICSDLLRDTLIWANATGLSPVAHVHDEVICEVPTEKAQDMLERLESIMTVGPKWAEGFPLKAEGHICQRYSK